MEEENKEYITGLFNLKMNYMIFSQVYKDKTFYKVQVSKKLQDGQILKAYIPVRFVNCEPVINGTLIRLKNAKVDWYKNPKDTWNVIPSLIIFNYEVIADSNIVTQQIVNEFNSTNDSDDDSLPF
jgi:hypothetical protein